MHKPDQPGKNYLAARLDAISSFFLLSRLRPALILFLSTLLFFSSSHGQCAPQVENKPAPCLETVVRTCLSGKVKTETTDASVARYKDAVVPKDKAAFLAAVAQAIETKRDRLRKILLQFNNVGGTDLEFELIDKLLKGAQQAEIYNLTHTRELNNVAVYAATNVPLYTLISHGVMPASISKNVWFRTPQTTRDAYMQLYAEIASALPPGTLDGLHMLTEARDVQYDNFNKQYVLGMNKRGTRPERTPAEIVLFTGNPETGKEILRRNQEKIREDGLKIGAFKQVFLGFGAGVNPVIVGKSARENMPQVIHWTLEPVRINSGQDCLSADFYAVPRSVAHEFKEQLLATIRKMKPGPNDDLEAGYTPLLMTKSFDKLIEYRAKYAKYLINPDAVIDQEKHLVSPHVFVFPISKFGEVEIQEHFGPFFTIFEYSSDDDLRKIAADPRVQRRAMLATVLGGNRSSSDLESIAKIFRQRRHSVSVNETPFGDLNGNLPFGGKGSDASMISTFDYTPDRGVRVNTGHYPVLFSTEAHFAFGDDVIVPKPSLKSSTEYQADLAELIALSKTRPQDVKDLPLPWQRLRQPESSVQQPGLDRIRQVIQKEGLYLVSERPRPAPDEVNRLSELYGVDFIFETDLPVHRKSMPTHGKGVVLHSGSIGSGPGLMNLYRGTHNPYLGYGTLHGLLDGNKLLEYQLTEAIAPGLMARTESFKSLLEAKVITERFLAERDALRESLNAALAKQERLDPAEREHLRSRLTKLIASFLDQVRTHFPEGAFIKNFDDFGTADLGTQITTMTTSPKAIASEFLRRFEQVKLAMGGKKTKLQTSKAQAAIKSDSWAMGAKFVNALLTDPSNILAQSRVKIAKTPMGFPLEVRVDFIDGEPVFGKLRFSHEYMPEAIEKCKAAVKDFFAKAPPEIRRLSGGADVVILADGGVGIIEWNFGNASGTLIASYFPVDCNEFMASLQGKPTPLLKTFEDSFQGGLEKQKAYLKTLKQIKPLWWKRSLDDLSVVEAAKWMRNRYLIDWSRSPSRESGDAALTQLKSLFEGFGPDGQEDLGNLLRGAELYIQDKLANKARSD